MLFPGRDTSRGCWGRSSVALTAGPALAKVLAEGQAKGVYYWQKIEMESGKIHYLCRSTGHLNIGI